MDAVRAGTASGAARGEAASTGRTARGENHVIKNRLAWGAALCTLAPAALAQQQDFSAVQIQTEQVADGLYMLVGAGGNIALSVGDDGALIVDTQFAPLTEKIQAAIRAAGGRDVAFVINTHWHGDHTGGNENFGKAGATIVGHANVRVRMSTEQFNATFNSTTPPSPAVALPVVVYPERTTLHWNGHTINIFHVPNAHTDGDVLVFFRGSDVVSAGGLVSTVSFPVFVADQGGSVDGFIAGLNRILDITVAETRAQGGTLVVSGHGRIYDETDVAEYRDMLTIVRDRIRAAIGRGDSLADVKRSRPALDYSGVFGAESGPWTTDAFIEAIYRDLAGNRRKEDR